jgi:F0F1-type ATP synthase beta subunit
MHGKRRRRSPLKSIWDSKKDSGLTKSKEKIKEDSANYQKTQKQPTGMNKKIVDSIVDVVTPDTAGDAIGMIGGAGVVQKLKKTGSKLYQTAKAAKTVKTGTGN